MPAINSCHRLIRLPLPYDCIDHLQWSDVDVVDEDDSDDETDDNEELPPSDEDEDEESPSSDYSYEYDGVDDEDFECNIWTCEVPIKIECGGCLSSVPTCTIRYLVESHGKLIMVRRHLRCSPHNLSSYTYKVEVFEADICGGAWVPLAGGLHGSVNATANPFLLQSMERGKVDENAIYFVDTGEVFHMRSASISSALWHLDFREHMWVFPPDLS